jgi:glycosyltransferase involved in cell wall biosynthesis
VSGGPRILHAPTDVAGNAYGLSRAERELGLVSDVAVLASGRFGFGADVQVDAGPDRSLPLQLARRVSFLRRAVRDYDIFHFNFGQTIMQLRRGGRVLDEAALLKRLGKIVLVTYQGCDVRPYEHCFCRNPACVPHDRYRQPSARRLLATADRVFFVNPDLRHWLPGGRFIPYSSLDPRTVEPVTPRDGDEVVVAHAPSDRAVKGTAHILQAVDRLRHEGVPIRLELIEGVPRSHVLERLAYADVVVDQLLLGWYGGLAVEAMALGKPVLAHVREDEPEDNPFGPELPVMRATPVTVEDELRRLALDAAGRRRLGLAGRAFVERHHDPRRIARTVLDGIVNLGPGSTSA